MHSSTELPVSSHTHLHSAEAFNLEPGFHLLGRGVVADVGGGQTAAARWSLELLLSAAAESESVHQLVLNLLHVGLAAWWVTTKSNLASILEEKKRKEKKKKPQQLSSLDIWKYLALVSREDETCALILITRDEGLNLYPATLM